ncbi:uncharacterized protein EDB91DRAFT_1251784 [Suillus paluster]|uniref:uncharacterized protein n=1 Tax=Suillus paluster TaxID=48578 RepID=UPI001B88598D|nr:uncharacterized protein EDB91DRAFT_1251784 [Suillus paluster]KAG1732431.1 hypothetical protein EDB91DRAFT_1251784 [Suillus paluster]
MARSHTSRSQPVATTRRFIYEKNHGIDSAAVESLFKPDSWVLNSNSLSDSLSVFGFNVFVALVVDLLHEFELGDLVHELDRRYRQVPPFGPATIRQFSVNTSELSNLAARNFEDLLQCSIPVFKGLLPKGHNKIIMDLLFIMAHWHGLAKLRMHSDLTLAILDQQMTDLSEQFRKFKATVCAAYSTQELDREVDAQSCRQAKDAAKWTETGKANGIGRGTAASTNAKGKQKASAEQLLDTPLPRQLRRKKSFNLQTYKFHALGDYVTSIRRFGTTDSYSTEPGELEHRMPKGRYRRTDHRAFVQQLTQIEQHQTRLHRIKQRQQQRASHAESNETASDPQLHHHISQSEKLYNEVGHYLRSHVGDPAMKDFLPWLKDHILDRIGPGASGPSMEKATHTTKERASILFKRNRIYHHNLKEYYINSFVDRDALMRFHFSLGVGHVYSHSAGVLEARNSAPQHASQTSAQVQDKCIEDNPTEIAQPSDGKWDEQDEEGNYLGVEELCFFGPERNASTESIVEALDEMFMDCTLDYDYEN